MKPGTHKMRFQPAQNKTFCSMPTPPTYRQLKQLKLQNNTLGLLCFSHQSFLAKILSHPALPGNDLRPPQLHCSANHYAAVLRSLISSYNILYPTLNSLNATLYTFHFPGAMPHNFVPKFHTHS